ncbi:hypothetical protein ACFQ7N_10715 [Streptomyces niveus]|uniref:hypothetical protein n=1 Tax=Streptomyces niveus TaxID=193462 RepID=UPI0036964C48
MADQFPVDDGDGLYAVTEALLGAFESLGPEHQALTAEAKETRAKERLGTLRRMIQCVQDANRTLVHVVDLVAKVYGMRALGISNQMARDADGRPYSPALACGGPDEMLCEAASFLQDVVRRLGEAYEPTKKHPDLSAVRRPQEMRVVLSGLRVALTRMCAELVARDLAENAAEFDPCIAFLGELENRVCRRVPVQTAGPTADDVTAAILASPEIASAAAAALARAAAEASPGQPRRRAVAGR